MTVIGRAEQGGSEWQARPPTENSEKKALNDEDFYEVSASKEAIAVFDLKTESILPLTEDTAKWYTGHYYKCAKGKKPYLIRAIYGQGGTGGYSLYRIGSALWISHGSLGSPAMNRSALIVNLDFEPTNIYVTRSIAR